MDTLWHVWSTGLIVILGMLGVLHLVCAAAPSTKDDKRVLALLWAIVEFVLIDLIAK